MSANVARLRGLERIRSLQEEIERASLERAMGAVAEVEQALRDDSGAITEAKTRARAALGVGDRSEWLFADAQGEVARSSISRLGGLLRQREAAVAPAMEGYLACRKLHEQAKVLLANAEAEAKAAELRRTQMEMDEWVISRWSRRAERIVKDS
jgi:flagellar export protein FliJ